YLDVLVYVWIWTPVWAIGVVRDLGFGSDLGHHSSKTGFDDWYLVNLFICGLPPNIGNGVRLYKPKILLDAYCLAIFQEQTHNFIIKNFSRSLPDSSKSKDSNEVVKNKMRLKDFNNSSKEGVKSKEAEHVGLGVFDELCEEIVGDSSGIEKDNDCVMDLDDDSKETESRVSVVGDEITIGEQDGNCKEDDEFGLSVHLLGKCYGLKLKIMNMKVVMLLLVKWHLRKKEGRIDVEAYMDQIAIGCTLDIHQLVHFVHDLKDKIILLYVIFAK
nr:hypothetical protein [Tanacetum cinerariifolium]